MANIELVIKIDDEMYKWVNDANKIFNEYGTSDFIDLVKNGITLPKGHGSLIDIQDVMKKVSLNYNSHQIIDAQSIKDIIRTTKITIPADKEE